MVAATTRSRFVSIPTRSKLVSILLLGSLFVIAAPVRAENLTADESTFITVRNPITSEEMSRVKSATEAARRRHEDTTKHLPADKIRPLTIVYDFNPDEKPSGTSLFGPCLDLASYIQSLPRGQVMTVAFVHQKVTRHTVLPVLACGELVMAEHREAARGDEVAIGDVFLDDPNPPPHDADRFYADHRVRIYLDTAKDRGRSRAIVAKMLDKDLEVLQGTRRDGSLCYVDARRPKDDDAAAVGREPILREKSALLTTSQAQKYGLCKRSLESRQEVADALGIPRQSLREDPLQGRTPVAWRIEVRGAFTPPLEEQIRRRINRAIGQHANLFIIQLEGGGGSPVVARNIADFLRDLKDTTGQFPVMTVAYVTNRASDYSVFPALGCTEIVMEQGAKLGDFERLLRENHRVRGQSPPEPEPLARSLEDLAAKRDYSPDLARAMVDRDVIIYRVQPENGPAVDSYLSDKTLEKRWEAKEKIRPVEEIKKKGDLLVLNAAKAQQLKFSRHTVENIGQVYEHYGLQASKVQSAGPDWLEGVANFLQHPMVSVVLVMIGITCLILELKVPGVGLPGVISAICFILFFWAHAQLAFTWLAVLLFLLGLVLIGLEIFVVPGLAVLGVSGVVLLLASLGLATLERWPQTESEWMASATTVGRFGLALLLAIVAAVVAARYLPNIPYANRLVLVPPGEREVPAEEMAASTSSAHAGLLGAIGVAATTLRPAGMVRFGEAFVDVIAEGSYVEPGARVQVIEIEGNRIVVKEV